MVLNKSPIPFANAFSDRCIIREITGGAIYYIGTLDRRTNRTAVLPVFFDAASIQGRLLLNFKAFGCSYTRGEWYFSTQQIVDSVCKCVFRSMYYKRNKTGGAIH